MIQEFKFGFFKINGKPYYDDLKIVNGRVKPWSDRRKHDLTLMHMRELIDAQPEIIVIGIGASGLLEVDDAVKHELGVRRIPFVIEKTPEACNRYNAALSENKKVAAIFHATC